MSLHAFGTHQPLLFAACLSTQGSIVELGAGFYSTPFIHALTLAQGRDAYTVETQAGYLNFMSGYVSDRHRLWLFDEEIERGPNGKVVLGDGRKARIVEAQARYLEQRFGRMTDISVVFVDHSPGFLRQPAVAWFADRTEFIVVHDTENEPFYRYDFSTFRHRLSDRYQKPGSTVLSNRRDCEGLRSYLWARGATGPSLLDAPLVDAEILAVAGGWTSLPLPAGSMRAQGSARMKVKQLGEGESDVQVIARAASSPDRGMFWGQILKNGEPCVPVEDGWLIIEACTLNPVGALRPEEVDSLEIRFLASHGKLVFDLL